MAWPIPVLAGTALGGLIGVAGRDSAKTIGQSSQGSSSGSSQSQGTWVPHAYAEPFYGFASEMGNYLAQNPVPYFPGQTYVGPSAPTQLGVAGAMAAGMAGGQGAQQLYGRRAASTPYYNSASNLAMGALGNQGAINSTGLNNYNFLSNAADVASNPYVQDMAALQAQTIGNAMAARGAATGSGTLGSSRQALTQGSAVGDATTQLLMNAYQQGLGAQQSALGQTAAMLANQTAPAQTAGMAGQYAQQGVSDLAGNLQNAQGVANTALGQIAGAGELVEDYQGRALQDAMQRYAYQYTEPRDRLNLVQHLAGLFQPMGTTYGSQAGYSANSGYGQGANPQYQSVGQALLGGAAAGAGIGSRF